MLDFMRALEAQALQIYQNKSLGSYDAIDGTHAKNRALLLTRLKPEYPHINISIECHGLCLRVIGDASPSQNDGFCCQFRLHPAQGFRANHMTTRSVMDLSAAGAIESAQYNFQLFGGAKI